jgi:hypothetical protein
MILQINYFNFLGVAVEHICLANGIVVTKY